VDAKGIDPAMAPTGGIQTGLGGTATDIVNASGSDVAGEVGAVAVGALLLGVAAAGRRRKRGVRVDQ